MARFRLSATARRDVFAILAYLVDTAGDSIALRYKQDFVSAFRMIAAQPGVGHKRDDLTTQPLRFFLVLPYLILYEERAEGCIVRAVLHGARDIRRIIADRKL